MLARMSSSCCELRKGSHDAQLKFCSRLHWLSAIWYLGRVFSLLQEVVRLLHAAQRNYIQGLIKSTAAAWSPQWLRHAMHAVTPRIIMT